MVAEHDRGIGCAAVIRTGGDPPATIVSNAAVAAPHALWALLAHARQAGHPVTVTTRPATARLLAPLTVPLPARPGLYVRVADPAALLDRLRPALKARLAKSPYARATGRLTISTYTAAIELDYHAGTLAPPRIVGGLHQPARAGAAGVPPDHLAELIFGRYSATGLAARYDDVTLGATAPLMETLFPQLSADLDGL